MCGIAGIYSFRGRASISPELLEKMVGALRHRGPDEAGLYVDGRVGLGHARLSIIDLERGTQPIHNEDESLWIIHNGEIFNYPELKRDLIARGHAFYTSSDTEVILHLYEEKGAACLDDLNGQFALAIWDSVKQELFLARDRIGIRPLYYATDNGRLLFASEIKSIFMCETVSREIDPLAMAQIFTFWTTLSSRTAFKGIHELPPGHYLLVSEGQVRVKRYWDIPFLPPEEQSNAPFAVLAEEVLDLLRDAVRIRLRADVPVGCYLSGGLDSSGVTALVARDFNSNVRTFGIRFEEKAFDEGRFQQSMVERLGVAHKEIEATNRKIGESFPDVIWHCEKPILRTAPVPLYMLSGLVRESGFKVVVTGEGADEFLGGYNIYREAKVRRFLAKRPDSKYRALLIGRLYPYIFDDPRLQRSLQSFFAAGLDQVADPLFSHLLRWSNTSKAKTFFSDELRQATSSYSPYDEIRETLPPQFARWDDLCKAQYLEATIFLSNYLLSSQGDRVAMANSVEIRVPYLDYRMMELTGSIPSKWKILGLREKQILKRAFRDILPRSITERPKHPYRAPISRSFFGGHPLEYVGDLLSEGRLKGAGLFDASRVGRLLKKIQSAPNPSEVDNMALVGVLSSQILHSQFIDDFPRSPPRAVSFDLVVDRRNGQEGRKKVGAAAGQRSRSVRSQDAGLG